MGRPRSTTHRDLPDNLIPRRRRGADGLVTYWYWRDPRDGKEKSLLCPDDRATAIRRARELNALVAVAMAGKIVTDLAASPQRQDAQFNVFATAYLGRQQKRVAQGRLAANTLRSRKSLINAAIERFGTRGMQTIKTLIFLF